MSRPHVLILWCLCYSSLVQGVVLETKLVRYALGTQHPFTSQTFDADTIYAKDMETDAKSIRLKHTGRKYEMVDMETFMLDEDGEDETMYAIIRAPDERGNHPSYAPAAEQLHFRDNDLMKTPSFNGGGERWRIEETKNGYTCECCQSEL